MTLANLVHGLRTEGTGCSWPPLYRPKRCRLGCQSLRRVFMRRSTILVVGLLLASTAMPQTADARPLILKMLRGMTPLGAVMGAGRHSSRRAAYHRRAVASRTRPAAIAAAPVAAGAATATTAAAPSGPAPQSAAPTTSGLAPSQDASAQGVSAQGVSAQNA